MSSLHHEIQSRVARYAQRISEQRPAGEQARYAPAYESVAVEVAKLDSPASGTVAWADVARDAGKLLEETTKDLWLASYLGYALYQTEGMLGAATGAELLAELLERYGPDLFPEANRVKARASAVAWFVERLAQIIPNKPADPAQYEALAALETASRRLSDVSRKHLAQHAPAFKRLSENLQRVLTQAAPQPAAEAGASAAETPAPQPSGATPAPASVPVTAAAAISNLPTVPELGDLSAVTDYLRNTGGALLSAAGALRRANSADPVAYRVLRTGLWLHLQQPPSPGANGRTTIPPLAPALRARIEQMLDKGRWAEALEESECALTNFRFALDLQRYSATALGQLGESHADARLTLSREVLTLLDRMPRLPELLAADGSPLADERTRTWLAELRGPATRTTRPADIEPITAPRAATPDAPVVSSELRDSLARLQETAVSARSGRERFLARLEMARLCANSGHVALAREIYEIVHQDAAAFSLDDWEPAIAISLLKGWASLKSSIHTEGEHPTETAINRLRRLARLDPGAILAIQDSKF